MRRSIPPNVESDKGLRESHRVRGPTHGGGVCLGSGRGRVVSPCRGGRPDEIRGFQDPRVFDYPTMTKIGRAPTHPTLWSLPSPTSTSGQP